MARRPRSLEYEALIIERFGTIVALALDSARKRELLRTQADTDELTGLLNRRAFNHRLDVLIHRARLTSTPLSLVEADIDEFKLINDRYGHGTGDTALIAVANALMQSVREGQFVARMGGEEFAIILPDTDALTSLDDRRTMSSQRDRRGVRGASGEDVGRRCDLSIARDGRGRLAACGRRGSLRSQERGPRSHRRRPDPAS